MAGALHKWTHDETLTLIRLRAENDTLFTGRRHTAKKAWEEILQMMGLSSVSPTQVSKKWDNLKRKYKELRCPATGTGTDRGEATAATWPYFSAMHEAIGGRPALEPPTLMDSACVGAVASGSGSASTQAAQSQATVEDDEATESGSDSHVEDVEPSTSAGPPPRKKKKSVLEFLQEEAAKEEERFERQHQAMQDTSKRFLDLFEKLVNKKD